MLRRNPWPLVAVCLGTFMLLVDISIVYVALPQIAGSLNATFSDLQWAIDAYALALAALLLNAGSLGDLFGHRRIYIAGLSLFSLASLICGFAGDSTTLDVGRALEGVGGAAMFATSLALLGNTYRARDRGVALSVWGATAGVAVAVGPLVGGALTTYADWSWIFFVNVPIGLATIALTHIKVDETERRRDRRPDWLGFGALSGGLVALVYALIRGNPDGWSSAGIVSALALGTALIVAFVVIEAKVAHPMLDLRLLRNRALVGAAFAAIAISASLFSMLLYITLYLQQILGYSAMETGVRFLSITGLVLLGAPISGRLSEKVPLRLLLGAGLGLVAVGLALMTGLSPADDWTALLAGFLVAGFGAGLTNPAIASAALRTVSAARMGVGSGVNNTARQIGIAGGIAGLGAVFQTKVHDAFIANLHAAAPELGRKSRMIGDHLSAGGLKTAGGHVRPDVAQKIAVAARAAFVSGFTDIAWIAAALAAVGCLAALVLVRGRDFVGGTEEARETSAPRQLGDLESLRRDPRPH
jgi:EmrB/QacA subfamily drug resistance transporter